MFFCCMTLEPNCSVIYWKAIWCIWPFGHFVTVPKDWQNIMPQWNNSYVFTFFSHFLLVWLCLLSKAYQTVPECKKRPVLTVVKSLLLQYFLSLLIIFLYIIQRSIEVLHLFATFVKHFVSCNNSSILPSNVGWNSAFKKKHILGSWIILDNFTEFCDKEPELLTSCWSWKWSFSLALCLRWCLQAVIADC